MKKNLMKNTLLIALFGFAVMFYQITLILLSVVIIGAVIWKIIKISTTDTSGWKGWK